MKKNLVLATLVLSALVFTACGSKGLSTQTTEANTTEKAETVKVYKVGIGQFAEHGSLDNCRNGFIEGMKSEGFEEGKNVTYLYDNAQTDGSAAQQIYNKYATQKVDIAMAIATPMAQVAYGTFNGTDTPVIFTAVSDPIAAELAKADGTPVGNVTGTSDKIPADAQLKLMTEMFPNTKNIGILYTTSEVNSLSAIEDYKKAAEKYNVNIVVQSIDQGSDMPLAVDTILPKVDLMTNLLDNTVVANMPVLIEKANAKKIPVFGSEIEQVHKGCIAAMGLDYIELGKQTGRMAAKVLKGEKKASEMNFEVIEEASLYLNNKVIENLGLDVDPSFATRAVEVYDDILQ
jgi:putative ABC transport system substrate-binding protein